MGSLSGKRVGVYARFSSDKQSDASIEDQVHRAREWIRAQGGDPDAARVFSDFAVSGASMDRPGMQALLAAVQTKQLDVVVTESVDRISRDVGDADRFRKLLGHHRVELACLDGTRIAPGDKTNALLFGVRSLFAEQYLADLSDKTRRGLEGRARAGAPTGSVPYGYRIVDRDGRKTIEIDPERAGTVRRIFTMFLAGHSLASIATTFNVEHIPAPRPHSRRSGQGWMHTAIRSMLLNEAYTGQWTYGQREWIKTPGTNKRTPRLRAVGPLVSQARPELAIVDPETFAAVQARFLERKRAPKRHRTYVLSGLVHCTCGARMTINGPSDRPYYRCSAAKNRGTCERRKNVSVAVVEDLAFSSIRARLHECVDEVLAICAEEIRAWAAARPDRCAELRRDIERRTRQISTTVDLLIDAPSLALKERLRSLEAEQARATAELASFVAEAPVLPAPALLRERIESLCDVRSVPVEEAREQLQRVAGKIECVTESDGSFTLRGALSVAPMLNAPAEDDRGVRHSLVAGAGFEPTTFGL